MNAGGDSGRDDYGLPPVDIEIPDDARELARDVLAYHREIRSRRRRHLARRFFGPITRDGMVLPLLAGCLALTLVAATLLTVFTARQPIDNLRPPTPASGSGASSSAINSQAATLIQTILYQDGQPMPLENLAGGPVLVLALVPPRCRCLTGLKELLVQAGHANTLIYLVGVHDAPVGGFAAALGMGQSQGLEDARDMLPAPYRVAALTAVLVRRDGTAIREVRNPGDGFQIENDVLALTPVSLRPAPASASPAGATPAPPTASFTPSVSASLAG